MALSGLTIATGVREQLAWARATGFRAVQLDAGARECRPRELSRSARRDLAALLRRSELTLSGVDLFLPPEHLLDPVRADRAMSALGAACTFAVELSELVTGSTKAATVSTVLPGGPESGRVFEALADAASTAGARIADHAWPVREEITGNEGGMPVGVGVDPAVLIAAGANPATEASRLAGKVLAARLSDRGPAGRTIAGRGKLDVLSYVVALVTGGYSGALVVDLRGLENQAGAGQSALELFR